MQKLKKNFDAVSAVILCIMLVLSCMQTSMAAIAEQIQPVAEPYNITEKISMVLQKSLDWLNTSQNDDGSWGDVQQINDTCYSIAGLVENGYDTTDYVAKLNEREFTENCDTLSHKLLATKDKNLASELAQMQNDDGGFGLKKQYASTVYDTVLALQAFQSMDTVEYNKIIENILVYLVLNQNVDGGWSYNEYNDSEKTITAYILYSIINYLTCNNLTSQEFLEAVKKADLYLSTVNVTDMSAENITEAISYSLLKQVQDDYTFTYDIVAALEEAQNENGSFYDNYYDTYLVIKYLNEIITIDEKFSVENMVVDLSKDNFIEDTPEKITGVYNIDYNTAVDKTFTIITTVYDEEKAIYSQESVAQLVRDKNTVSGECFNYTVDESEPKVLKVVSVLKDGETELKTYSDFIYINEKPIEPKTEISETGIILNKYSGYTGERDNISASFYLLYSTNVYKTLTAKAKIYCGKEVVGEIQNLILLTPDGTSSECLFAEMDILSDKAETYDFIVEFYDGENLLTTATASYVIYEKPEIPTDPEPDIPEEEIKKFNVISQFNLTLDNYCTYVSDIGTSVTANCEMLYNFYQDANITVKGYVLDDEEVLMSNEQVLNLSKNNTSYDFKLLTINNLDISDENVYTFKAEIYDSQNNFIGETTVEYKIIERPKANLVLTADTNTGKDYCIDLKWNEISDSYEKFGYRVLRSEDNGKTWETRSSWNGSEKVKVLNIYPYTDSQRYLKEWMNKVVDSKTGETVGKGLFEIDTVHIDNYNNNPDYYLKDSNGEYKYNVLVFGTYDCNNGRDLNEKSQKATQSFIDFGGGVLFGHDTIAEVYGDSRLYHPYFNKFTEQLGICNSTYYGPRTSKVDVVLNGFLTSFPWKISGTLTVPTTHCLTQYAGGELEGTVWMKLKGVSATKLENGATDDFYLVTNNQLAMIQTGHSNGNATIDECKVFANTLFYLKQLTNKTAVRDNSFYDTTAPSKPDVNISLTQFNKDNYSISSTISSKDFGTTYKYRVEGIPTSGNTENVISNTVVSEAFSDLKGFVVIESNSADSAKDQIKYEDDGITVADVISAQDGKITYEMNNLVKNKKFYLHIFAVDNENNISEEYVQEISDCKELISQAQINSSLSCDKPVYMQDDEVTLTAVAYTTGSSINATADIKIYDLDGNFIETVAENINTQLASVVKWSENHTWKIKGVDCGKYMAEIVWYVDNVPVTSSQRLIRVEKQDKAPEVTLDTDVTEGADYSNTLNWTELNNIDDENSYIPTDFAIVVDCSYSMENGRLDNAKVAVDHFISLMNEGDRASIIRFGFDAYLSCGFTSDKTILYNASKRLDYLSGTTVSNGLNMAVNQFLNSNNTSEHKKAIILICDGDVDNCDWAVNQSIQNDITIYPINIVNADSNVLQSFADKTGGKYYYTNIVSNISEILQYIKLMNDKGEYYYNIQRDNRVIDAVTKATYPDNKFLDTSAPKIFTTQINVSELGEDTYSGYISVNSSDIGTDYEYKINAINKLDETKVVTSNTVVAKAISGIKGYAYRIDTNSNTEPDVITDESCFVSSTGEISLSIGNCKRGVVYYLHLYAIDNAGNVSEETTYEFTITSNPFNIIANITTDITTDKSEYSFGDIILFDVNARANFYKRCATGVVEIYDCNNTIVDVVETGCIEEITSYENWYRQFAWNVTNILSGDYKASVKWYDGTKLLASDSTEFKIVPDGKITDNITTDKVDYMSNEKIKISDFIYNNTTNTYANDLVLNIDIYSTADKAISLKSFNSKISSLAGYVSTYSDYLKADTLGIGEYVVISQVKNNKNVLVTSSSAYFSISDYTQLSELYSGIINVNPVSDKEKEFAYSVTNTGNKDGKNLTVKANVYNSNGQLITAIEKDSGFAVGETINFKELFNTEALKIDTYPVTLSVISEDGKEVVLASSGFVINKLNKYKVTFVNEDGTILDTQMVEYGSSAKAPASPVKPSDAQYSYKFSKWDTDYTNITKDTTVTAVYEATVNKYKVTFVNWDGTLFDVQFVEYGSGAKTPAEVPVKDTDGKNVYKFAKWDKDYSVVTEDMTITAVYNSESLPTQPETQATNPATKDEVIVQTNNTPIATGQSGMLLIIFIVITGLFAAIYISKAKNRKDV